MFRPAIAVVLLPACMFTRGSGVTEEEVRTLDGFSEVRATNQVDVFIDVSPDTAQGVIVRCDDNLLDFVLTEVEGDGLVIKSPPGRNLLPQGPCEVEIALPWLGAVESTGSGDVLADGALLDLYAADGTGSGEIVLSGIDTAEVRLDSTGSGGISAAGIADCGTVTTSGSGDITARDLTVGCAHVRTTGSGDVQLTATESADVTITGSGGVTLWGGAQVDLTDTGSGKLVER